LNNISIYLPQNEFSLTCKKIIDLIKAKDKNLELIISSQNNAVYLNNKEELISLKDAAKDCKKVIIDIK